MAGGQVTYTVTVTNNGTVGGGRRRRWPTLLPGGAGPVSAVSSRGTCTVAAEVTCDIGDLPGPDAAGQPSGATVTITADVPPDFPVGAVTNTATTSTPTADPVPGNDDGSVVTEVTAVADVSVSKTADPVQPAAGENVTFTVTVGNAGPSTARDVVLADALPPGLTLRVGRAADLHVRRVARSCRARSGTSTPGGHRDGHGRDEHPDELRPRSRGR